MARVRRPHRFSRVPLWFLALITVAGAGVFFWHQHRVYQVVLAGRIADAKEWRIDGPPCPIITKAQFLGLHHKGPKKFEYENVSFFRRYGHVSCAPVYEKGGRSSRFYPVCQFTGPGDLLIRTKKGDWYFQPGPGQPATVSTPRDQARCVMASKFTMKSVLAEMKGEKPVQ
jgi:hypothetical protein